MTAQTYYKTKQDVYDNRAQEYKDSGVTLNTAGNLSIINHSNVCGSHTVATVPKTKAEYVFGIGF